MGAIFISSAIATVLLVGVAERVCLFGVCLRDDAAMRASALIGGPPIKVLPAMFLLRPRVGHIPAVLVVPVAMALVIAGLLHRSKVDGSFLNTAAHLIPWFSRSCFLAGLAALALWPTRTREAKIESDRVT